MTEFLNVPRGRIAYEQAGQGPLVVCVPGLGDLRGVYRFLTPQLTGAGYRVATIDLRGHGQSSTNWDSYSQASVGVDIIVLTRRPQGQPAPARPHGGRRRHGQPVRRLRQVLSVPGSVPRPDRDGQQGPRLPGPRSPETGKAVLSFLEQTVHA